MHTWERFFPFHILYWVIVLSQFSYFLHHLMRMADNNFDRFVIVSGEKGCLSGDTPIKTAVGNFRIKDIAARDEILSYNFKSGRIERSPCKLIDSGVQDVNEIELESGKKVKATLNHVFFVKRDDKIIELQLKDIKEGDLLVSAM
jgi:hypothetical protein